MAYLSSEHTTRALHFLVPLSCWSLCGTLVKNFKRSPQTDCLKTRDTENGHHSIKGEQVPGTLPLGALLQKRRVANVRIKRWLLTANRTNGHPANFHYHHYHQDDQWRIFKRIYKRMTERCWTDMRNVRRHPAILAMAPNFTQQNWSY